MGIACLLPLHHMAGWAPGEAWRQAARQIEVVIQLREEKGLARHEVVPFQAAGV